MDRTVDYEHPEVVLIKDGKISFFIRDFNLRVTVKVKQIKGLGTADADDLIEINHWHKFLLESMLGTTVYSEYTVNDILKSLEIRWHFLHQDDPKEFKDNNWRRPISEILRKGILTPVQGKTYRYHFHSDKAKKALTNGRFD